MSTRHKVFLVALLVISPYLMAYEKEVASLSSIAQEGITKAGKKNVAVVDFIDLQGNITELGRFIGEELSCDLVAQAKGFEVVDRIHLKTILAEHKIAMSGLVDPRTVKQLGQIAGVDAIITGCVTPFGDSIRVTCKVITTDTAKVISAGKTDIAKTKAIEELLARGISQEAQASPSATSPAKTQQKVEIDDFVFELQGCKLSGGTVKCSLVVTNKGKDRELEMYAQDDRSCAGRPPVFAKLFDNLGNEYHANRVQLSNKENSYEVMSLLVSGISTKASLVFEGISQEAKSVALLEIWCYSPASPGPFNLQFRNIALTK